MTATAYADFDLEITRAGEGRYLARVIHSPAGEASAEFEPPVSELELENFVLKVGRASEGMRHLLRPGESRTVETFGRQLFERVFRDEVRECLISSLHQLDLKAISGLTLKLRLVGVPELANLPWEYLYLPARKQFLALSEKTPIIRYPDLPRPITPLAVTTPLRLLGIAASPLDYPVLDVERERQKLREALAPLEREGLVTVDWLEVASLAVLQRRLRQQARFGPVHILHYIGHGVWDDQIQDGVLLFEDETKHGQRVSAGRLATILRDHDSLRLVVLNACEGARHSASDPFAGLALTLVGQGIPAVIAMQFAISDRAAIQLAQVFYEALADGYTLERALTEARKDLFASGNEAEWGTPVLYLHAPDGRVFDLAPPAAGPNLAEVPGAAGTAGAGPRPAGAEQAAVGLGSAPAPTGTLTFLFTDIEGSTRRWEEAPEAMRRALDRHDAILRQAIQAHQGYVFKTLGDAFCAAFSSPNEAVAAAVEAQLALRAEDWSACSDAFEPLGVRVGVHTGEAEYRHGDYIGQALNRVARLTAAARGGQILLSLATQQLVRDRLPSGIGLVDRGEHRLKDLRYSEHIFQVSAPGLAADAGLLDIAPATETSYQVSVDQTAEERSLPESLALLLDVALGRRDGLLLTADQLRSVLDHRPGNLTEVRLQRLAEWSQPRYRLDGRFVELSLLLDQGEDAPEERWAEQAGFHDLGVLLAAVPDPALVLLGPPGSGKSTILRRFDLDVALDSLAIDALRSSPPIIGGSGGQGPGDEGRITFFVALNQYPPASAGPGMPEPFSWIAERWRARYPDLPPLPALLAEGRVVLLLDGLNEIAVPSVPELFRSVALWQQFLVELVRDYPGNRAIFTCRTLDYSAPLSTPELRVPQVRIEPMSDEQVRTFLKVHTPLHWRAIWSRLVGTRQLELLRAPYFLHLLVEHAEATGEIAAGRAELFTGFVRQALKREMERGNPLFAPDGLLASRDWRQVAQWQWQTPYDLPRRGALVAGLERLAFQMQRSGPGGESIQVRVPRKHALHLLDHARAAEIVAAGEALAVLDADPATEDVLFYHQLLQEYFAARHLVRRPDPALARVEWRAAHVPSPAAETLAALAPADPLPPLPATGWEEATVLAAAMTPEPDAFVADLMPANLVLAARCAVQPEVDLGDAVRHRLRSALVGRTRDVEADVRARIAAGLMLGELGDPRFERRMGPWGPYLMPPLVTVPGGDHRVGDDAPIDDGGEPNVSHTPAHRVALPAFQIGQFALTNGEWAYFMAAGGYEDERWWDSEGARAWWRGEDTAVADRLRVRYWLEQFRARPELMDEELASGRWDEALFERWQQRLQMTRAEFEAHLRELYPGGRLTEPRYWQDADYTNPLQPVIGVSWFEARAYCLWLSAQTGLNFRLPSEVEWEAVARAPDGRQYAFGDQFDPLRSNTADTHLRRPTPVGAFPDGDGALGVADMTGNTQDWTASLWGRAEAEPEFRYPYDPSDGREDVAAPPDVFRIVRGGSWYLNRELARAAFRSWESPDVRTDTIGFRVVCAP